MKAPMQPPHLIFHVIEYGLNPDHELFTLKDLNNELKLQTLEIDIVKKYLVESVERANPNHIMYVVDKNCPTGGSTQNHDWTCTLLPSAIIQYNEYEEIILAGENATEARKQANAAISIQRLQLELPYSLDWLSR